MCKYFYSFLVLDVRFCQDTTHACVYLTRLIFESVYFTMIILMRVVFQQQKNYM
jgi:hypothetical protein